MQPKKPKKQQKTKTQTNSELEVLPYTSQLQNAEYRNPYICWCIHSDVQNSVV